jgi:hypothetical protein
VSGSARQIFSAPLQGAVALPRRQVQAVASACYSNITERITIAAHPPQEAHMIELHYWPTPNGKKVTILLEECDVEYRVVECNIGKGDQFTDQFLAIGPNNRRSRQRRRRDPGHHRRPRGPRTRAGRVAESPDCATRRRRTGLRREIVSCGVGPAASSRLLATRPAVLGSGVFAFDWLQGRDVY